MRRITAIFVVLATSTIVMLTWSCEKSIDEVLVTVSGTIIDSLSKLPLGGAWIVWDDTIQAKREFSDSSGNYQLQIPGGHDRQIYFGKDGYKPKKHIIANAFGNVTGIDVELAPDTNSGN